jgi:hypothetical protein
VRFLVELSDWLMSLAMTVNTNLGLKYQLLKNEKNWCERKRVERRNVERRKVYVVK